MLRVFATLFQNFKFFKRLFKIDIKQVKDFEKQKTIKGPCVGFEI